ncbi:DUF6551 family protein [Shinella zoogloeoides]|uniref:DUF6551 family protein n=1 Tax=Shinella zoogloeoides TaxID=352475 RepID=UPI00299F2F84|nr:DUF6551 family protein [Shinella zoogloeoides]WPE19892.1 hypothetical protein ShzoTeo12_10680 [Shinella zoogloeoides]
MRIVDPSSYARFMRQPKSSSLGVEPRLAWIPISKLRIDPAYQREILRNGQTNILKIAMNFDWALFGVVVVAEIGDGLFAIVDGQHRTTAAAVREAQQVPCIVIEASPAKQAEAFAAINGAVTAISPLAIFAAKVAAEDADALALTRACEQAGVSICRYPVPASNMKPGQTLAVQALQSCAATYGLTLLTLALKGVVRAANGRPGLVKAAAVKAVVHVFEVESSWQQREKELLVAIARFDLAAELAKAEASAKTSRRQVHNALALALFDFLDAELG